MKFRIWLIYRRISKTIKSIYYSRFLCWVRQTLLFNIIVMTTLVLGIVYILFLFLLQKQMYIFQMKLAI